MFIGGRHLKEGGRLLEDLPYSNLKFCVLKHDIACASEEIIIAEVGGHTSEHDAFHDVNSILYTAYPLAGILLKVIKVFCSENLAVFTVISIHCIRKSTKNRNSDPKWKATENSRLKQVKRRLKKSEGKKV